jgi:hypothetical protein
MRKYRTKSGTVEEKLPGVNATVNPSEKAQIAMAGGADTLKDVQTILGQEGKRNNLKGQGAKHLISFQGFSEGPEAYGDSNISTSGFAPSDMGDTYSPPATPLSATPSFDQAYGGGDTGGPDLSSIPATAQEIQGRASKAAASSLKAQKAAAAQTIAGWIPADYTSALKKGQYDEYDPDKPHALLSPLDKDQRTAMEKSIAKNRETFNKEFDESNKPGIFDKAQQVAKDYSGLISIGGFVMDVASGIFPPLAAGKALVGYGVGKAMNPDKTVEKTASMEDIASKPSQRHGPESDPESIQYNIQPTPPPDPDGDSDPKKKKKKLIRPAANNVTLGISEKRGRSTRDIMRRRGGWRFA